MKFNSQQRLFLVISGFFLFYIYLALPRVTSHAGKEIISRSGSGVVEPVETIFLFVLWAMLTIIGLIVLSPSQKRIPNRNQARSQDIESLTQVPERDTRN